jgi:hypothetical protein
MHIPDSIRQGLGKIPDGDLAIVLHEGQVHVLFKVPYAAFQVLKLPPAIRHFLFLAPMPTAPIVGWFFDLQDDSDGPFQLNAFFNIRDSIQSEILAQLPHQSSVPFHIIDGEVLVVAGTVTMRTPFNASQIYAGAISSESKIVSGYDYMVAKARFEAEYPIKMIARWWPSRTRNELM